MNKENISISLRELSFFFNWTKKVRILVSFFVWLKRNLFWYQEDDDSNDIHDGKLFNFIIFMNHFSYHVVIISLW